jgi:tetratricopeptide (TPR) repeat protein
MSDILESSRTVDNSIDTTVAVIIAISVIIIVLFLSFIVWCILLLIHAIQSPIHHLTAVCQNIISNQLTMTSLPEEIQCRDMKILLDTFKNIVIVLRFGNEAYISGNIRKALQVYTEALSLYETLSNEKGMSACLNNLGGIYLTMKDFTQSEVHYQRSISMASQQLSKLGEVFEKNPSDDLKAQMTSLSQTLSDRQANYALLLIEEEKYAEAYSLLESCLEDDLKRGYINGCVNKQGYLGFLYLRQNEMKSAEKQFLNSLLFLDNHQNQSKLLSGAWTMEEIEVSKQIALFNYGKLSEDKRDVTAAIHYYVMSLEYPAKMHLMTTIKTLSRLYSIYAGGNSFDSSYLSSSSSSLSVALKKFEKICEDLSLSIANKSHSSVVKRIAIALDYSGSMSGMKIRSATENILSLFDEQIQPQDQLMLLHFNSRIIIDVRPFTLKEGHEDQIRAIIRSLNQPSNGTALYDAMNECIRCMTLNHPGTAPVAPGNDWIVVLTDGEDTGSMMSKDAIQRSF